MDRGKPAISAAVHQAFWRWHFYAGLIVMPVLMLMALTGGVYLFQDEIGGALHRPLFTVQADPVELPAQAWIDAARAQAPGRIAAVVPPADPGHSAQVVVELPRGVSRTVYVDPHTARVLGHIDNGGVMQLVKRLHSLDLAGPVANLMVEVVAGWAIVMVATGVVLWWPRGASGGVVTIRGRPRQRLFWRDAHAVIGVFTGAIIVFLAATGMPWSAFWGKEVRSLTTQAGWGRPAAPQAQDEHAAHNGGLKTLPWALEDHVMADMPGMIHARAIGVDEAIAAADRAGLPRPYVVAIPTQPGKAWTASHTPAKAEGMRTLYFSPSTGKVMDDVGYSRFGPAAKAIEWGIAVHQGKEFGPANKLVMLAGCVAIWLLGLSGLVMWWKRRPAGGLGAPARPLGKGGYRLLAAVVAPLAVLYPLVGLSLVAVLGADLALAGLRGPPRQAA